MFAAASPLPQVPAHVTIRPGDEPFWDGIVRARAREEWNAPDLVIAAQLARCQRDIETESLSLDVEGSVIRNDKGTPIQNPRHGVLEQLARREMALMRSLSLSGVVAKGEKKQLVQARDIQRQADSVRNSLKDEDLLPT